ncbi:magnesium chelatase [Candidatus Jorgensenbacteria bacterium CG10_big_fil_rev_8_21_14_0_10_54_38]|uniref:Magnesium chelatase n=1 Tax=Candidatus Jorgensenbacteria bacterium CG10_big_fil_rev_8_21_14_0_10_54_38 TaxID=1974593 RepID=A0A2M6WGH2_9BACT|nr:MAG: magnesium chelatase [Candidatus Jorgensenbacteria bacterium CG10_big_fil_rev_8_21_14_0_10_54_38]
MSAVPKLFSAELDGIDAYLVEIEADLNVGLHAFSIVGLADKAVGESKERVNSALKHTGIRPPTKENRRITVNLAPADMEKAGSRFDLPIALAYLLASEQLAPFSAAGKLFVGELSLDGTLRPVNGCLNIAIFARTHGIEELFVPRANAEEAAAVSGISVIPVGTLGELIAHLEARVPIPPTPPTAIAPSYQPKSVQLHEVRGNEAAKRALLVAAAGGHHLLMSGPPGTGKTMLAQALASILPPPTVEESIEITRIYSAAGLNKDQPFITFRPFRTPHHSASLVSILGGGSHPRPGEVSLAHRGVLFLDEIPEFHRDILEGLRQPLEEGAIHIARAKRTLTLPARFTLIASMNPCPCGYFEDPEHECRCSAHEIFRYQRKISGPLLDRIDMHLTVPRISVTELREERAGDAAETERARGKVTQARERQRERFKTAGIPAITNSEMTSSEIEALVSLEPSAESFLKRALERAFLSPRGYYRTLKVARTVADLDGSFSVKEHHLAEAFQYRVRNNE